MKEQKFVVDTSALYNFPGWLKRLSKALKKGELNGKKVKGEIVVPESVFGSEDSEVNKKYSRLLKQKKQGTLRKGQKELFKKARKAKVLLDKELAEKNGVWRVQGVTNEIQWAMRQMKNDPKLYKMENPPNDNDLLIVGTAMYLIHYRKRPNRVTVLSWDGGVLKTLRYCGVSLKGGNPKDLFRSYWKWRKFMIKLGLKKEDLKKGD